MIKLLVLNLLEIKEMSVYDIKSSLKEFDAMRWANILIGSIQNAVNSLYKQGHIDIESIQSVGKRKKTIYKITETGKLKREEWIKEAIESEKIQFSYDFFIALSGINSFNIMDKINMLNNRKEKLLEAKLSIKEGIETKEEHTDLDKIQYLVVENMKDTIDIQLNLVEEIIKYLEEDNEN